MHTVAGQIMRFLETSEGGLYGLVLDCGEVVRFPVTFGPLISRTVHVGSHIGVEGTRHDGNSTEHYWEPSLMINFDSRRSVNFLAPHRQDKPGMLPQDSTPNALAASLVHPGAESLRRIPRDAMTTDILPSSEQSDTRHSAQPCPSSRGRSVSLAERNYAADAIGTSYDSLQRLQAILAYLHIMKHHAPGIGQLLDEAKHIYQVALSHFHSRNFSAAAESAAASACLSRVVEILVSRALRSDSSLPSFVPPPPRYSAKFHEIEAELAEADSVLGHIHVLLENGDLPLEARSQVRRIVSWAHSLSKQARYSCKAAFPPDAFSLAYAALEGAHSAEHLCRRWYPLLRNDVFGAARPH